MAFFSVYVLGGVGCAVFAWLRCSRRHILELFSLVLLWPLCAPFLFGARADSPHRPTRRPEEEMQALTARCIDVESRLGEIDAVLVRDDWDRELVASKLGKSGLQEEGGSVTRDSLSLRLGHIERLHFLRKVQADELEAAQALLEQLKSQAQLSRFLEPRDGDTMRLEEIRERIADSEAVLASETELISLCRESL